MVNALHTDEHMKGQARKTLTFSSFSLSVRTCPPREKESTEPSAAVHVVAGKLDNNLVGRDEVMIAFRWFAAQCASPDAIFVDFHAIVVVA